MKKRLKIILIIVGILLILLGYFGYQIYKFVNGAEELSGNKESIPKAVSTLPPLTKGTADWTCWRGPNSDGKSVITGIKTDWSSGLNKLWQIDYLCQGKANASWSAPVVQGNRLIVTGRDDKNDLVFCINAENGELIWMKSYEAEAENSHGPGARATPFIDDNRVYTFGRSGDLACWMLEDGNLLWKKNVKDIGGIVPQWGCSSSPFVLNDKVIVQGGGTALIVAYNKMTGDIIWKSLQGDGGYSAFTTITIENETRLLAYHAKALSLLNPIDGKELWRAPWETDYGVNATTPLVDGNLVFHTSGYGMGCQVLEVKKDGFSVKWKSDVIASQHSDPVLIDGNIYGYSGESSGRDGKFKCVEMATGKELWSTSEISWGTIIYVDGYLICFDVKGNLYLVKPNPKEFQKVGEIKKAMDDVKNPAWTAPIVANGKLYLRYLQHLVCYNLVP
jgi:outer membrane protein assembly factor BamB